MFYIKEELLFRISDAGRCIQISVGSKRYNMIVSLPNGINVLRGGVDGVLVSFFDFQALDLGSDSRSTQNSQDGRSYPFVL